MEKNSRGLWSFNRSKNEEESRGILARPVKRNSRAESNIKRTNVIISRPTLHIKRCVSFFFFLAKPVKRKNQEESRGKLNNENYQ